MSSLYQQLTQEMQLLHDTVLVTITQAEGSTPRGAGAQMLVNQAGAVCGTIGGGSAEYAAICRARNMLSEQDRTSHTEEYLLNPADPGSSGMVCGGQITVRFAYIAANDPGWKARAEEMLLTDERERVLLFGAGHCAQALVPVLDSIGFRVTVIDDREALLTGQRFPDAERLICSSFTAYEEQVRLCKEDYVVVMTSGHLHDYEIERQILSGPFVAYLGVIGSKRKIKAVNEKLLADGIPKERIADVHTPIGLAIGAVTPEEIAISIAAEMIRVRADRRSASGIGEKRCPMTPET